MPHTDAHFGRDYQLVTALAGLLTEPTQGSCFWTRPYRTTGNSTRRRLLDDP